MKTKYAFACVALTVALSGCADTLMSDSRLRDNTAMALGQPPASVSISDRHYDGFNVTYFVAKTYRGTFNCQQEGGTVLDMGTTSHPPHCSR